MDHLLGLKENVIIGKLIPAGTGLEFYRNVEVVPVAKLESKEGEAAAEGLALAEENALESARV